MPPARTYRPFASLSPGTVAMCLDGCFIHQGLERRFPKPFPRVLKEPAVTSDSEIHPVVVGVSADLC